MARNENSPLAEYQKAIELANSSKNNHVFPISTPEHASIILSTIFEHSKEEVNILAGNLSGTVSNSKTYLDALDSYLKSGKTLRVLLTDMPNINSLAYQLIEKHSKLPDAKIELRIATEVAKYNIAESFDNKYVHFVVGDDSRFRLETDSTNYQAFANFNDPVYARKLNEIFDRTFASSTSTSLRFQPIYEDTGFIRTSNLIIPDFKNINLELIEYFSKHPYDLEKMEWRKFEMLLDFIFKNQGYTSILGPGSGDKGVDIRLIQKDSIGEMITLVQAKKYKSDNPIKLEAVCALTALVERERANRGLFVTTSRFLPGVEEWAKEEKNRLILANSNDISKWCQEVSTKIK